MINEGGAGCNPSSIIFLWICVAPTNPPFLIYAAQNGFYLVVIFSRLCWQYQQLEGLLLYCYDRGGVFWPIYRKHQKQRAEKEVLPRRKGPEGPWISRERNPGSPWGSTVWKKFTRWKPPTEPRLATVPADMKRLRFLSLGGFVSKSCLFCRKVEIYY